MTIIIIFLVLILSFSLPNSNVYDLSPNVPSNITNILGENTYHLFISNITRFHRINITMILKTHAWFTGFNEKEITFKEFQSRTDDYYSYISENIPNYYKNPSYISEDHKVILYNFFYDIKNNTVLALVLYPWHDQIYLYINICVGGDLIEFEDNHSIKTYTNLKAKNPYYFYTNISYMQTINITFITKYNKYFPFEYVDILGYENKENNEIKTIKNNHYNFMNIDEDKLTAIYSYQEYTSNINYIAFRIESRYDLDNITAKIDIVHGPYLLNKGDNKIFRNIIFGYDLYFWIKISQLQKLKINLKFNYSNKNPINYIDIFEYGSNNIFYTFYKHENKPVIIERNGSDLLTYLPYITEYSSTNYILLKIHPEENIDYLEIYTTIDDIVHHLINSIPKNLTNIKSDNQYFFFIEATIYNKLFIQLNSKNDTKKLFNYISINEHEKENNLTYIKSTNQTIGKIKIGNEFIINLSYTPENPLTKYISLVLNTNYNINYLSVKIDVWGGYYEFKGVKNISKIISGSVYYIQIKISIFQKVTMKLIMADMNINPFIYADIYEKEKQYDNKHIRYYNQIISNERKLGQLIEYFTYSIDEFTTNYILIELKPNINIKYILIQYEIANNYYELSNGENKTINALKINVPYYLNINIKQFEQINITLITDYLVNNPFEFIEIYEISDKLHITEYNKYINKSIQFTSYNNKLINSFSKMIDSFYTTSIFIKIKTNYDLEYLNIKMSIGGGAFEINKGTENNITNLFPGFSYYFLILSSNKEKLNITLTIKSNETDNPFNSMNIYEYSSKKSSLDYLKNTTSVQNTIIKDNKLIISLYYQIQSDLCNYVGLEMIPNYQINSIEWLIETEEEKNNNDNSSVSVIKILIIILVIIISITLIIFFIYIKKFCLKPSSSIIEEIDKLNNESNEKKFELALMPIDQSSSSN